jgi:hypothetical protein
MVLRGPVWFQLGDLPTDMWSVSNQSFVCVCVCACVWCWGLNSVPTPWATPPALFYDRFFWDRVSWTNCPGWLRSVILLITASFEKLGLQVWATGAQIQSVILEKSFLRKYYSVNPGDTLGLLGPLGLSPYLHVNLSQLDLGYQFLRTLIRIPWQYNFSSFVHLGSIDHKCTLESPREVFKMPVSGL